MKKNDIDQLVDLCQAKATIEKQINAAKERLKAKGAAVYAGNRGVISVTETTRLTFDQDKAKSYLTAEQLSECMKATHITLVTFRLK